MSDNIDLTKLEKLGCAFSGLTVKIATDSTVYKYNQAGNAIYDISGKTLVKVLNAEGIFEIDAGTENIAPYAFANSKVTGVALPYSIKTIGEGAFMNSDLAQITIAYDSQIEEIKPYTFYGTDITEIELPGFTTVIGDYAFAKSALTSIEFLGTTLGDNVFDGCTNLTEIVLYDSIEVMGSRVFANCSALQKVTLPSVKELGYGTFLNSPALKEVTFGANATTTGVATFMSMSTDGRINLTKVVLGNATKEIGDSAFENCVNLTSIDLKGATKVGEAAFYGCTKLETVTGLENVEIFGEYAFALCPSIKTLNLNSAKTIGALAFAMLVEDDVEVYTQINIPKVETIGELAFYGGSQTSVTLPATLAFVDYGAFNSSKNLTAITVENGNACYFSENGVLYRYITDTTYELVAYPTALVAKEDAEGLKTYEVKVGTVTVLADSFSFLNEDVLDKVIFPYSLKTIGDEAMYASGVSVYEFNSIAAPTLEASYREDIQSIISSYDSQSSSFKGYFYSNFNELFVYFSEFVNQKSDLTIRYPENGTGYDNYIYGRYFGEKVTTGVHMDDSTRQTIAEITALKDAQTVKGWLAEGAAITKAEVEAFSELVKNARRLYDNIKSEAQLAYVDQSLVEKLLQVETELRAVKAKFGIIVSVSRLIYDATNCKVEYLVGEEFNPEGLIVTAVYDDGSTEVLDVSKLTLVTTGKLTKWDRYVEYKGPENKSLRVQITVTEKATHVCESVCPECGKCQDASCTEAACADKCQGHHVCESVCPDCGKCQNANCTDPVCQEKCSGHETEGGCKDYGASLIATFIALATVAVVLVIKKRRNARG
ncbi:MAG: leucine-rich repeat protein [Clostridia bacterium]|nr:leucine-rich repeat protein [Clostridia bacterium]